MLARAPRSRYGTGGRESAPTPATGAAAAGSFGDVEGDLDYFNRWVAGSRCVAYTGSDEAALTLTHARAYFVYGGDVPDHGRGSEQLLRLLVGLKRAFPRRVALLVGNRDLNKTLMLKHDGNVKRTVRAPVEDTDA